MAPATAAAAASRASASVSGLPISTRSLATARRGVGATQPSDDRRRGDGVAVHLQHDGDVADRPVVAVALGLLVVRGARARRQAAARSRASGPRPARSSCRDRVEVAAAAETPLSGTVRVRPRRPGQLHLRAVRDERRRRRRGVHHARTWRCRRWRGTGSRRSRAPRLHRRPRRGRAGCGRYQQRGRCSRLPPMVAALRTCGVAACAAASASAGYRRRISGDDSICASVTSAPSVRPRLRVERDAVEPVDRLEVHHARRPRRCLPSSDRPDRCRRPWRRPDRRARLPAEQRRRPARPRSRPSIRSCLHRRCRLQAFTRAARRARSRASSAACGCACRWRCRTRWRSPRPSRRWPARRRRARRSTSAPPSCSRMCTSISGISREPAILY